MFSFADIYIEVWQLWPIILSLISAVFFLCRSFTKEEPYRFCKSDYRKKALYLIIFSIAMIISLLIPDLSIFYGLIVFCIPFAAVVIAFMVFIMNIVSFFICPKEELGTHRSYIVKSGSAFAALLAAVCFLFKSMFWISKIR